MFQVAKWDIVRAREKEMLFNLQILKEKQQKVQKCMHHVLLYKIIVKWWNDFKRLAEYKKHIILRFKSTCTIYMKMIMARRKYGRTFDERMRRSTRRVLMLNGHTMQK